MVFSARAASICTYFRGHRDWSAQSNARTAYDAVLRFLPWSLPAISAAERQAIANKLRELKKRLENSFGCCVLGQQSL